MDEETSEMAKKIGAKLLAEREKLGLSLAQIADQYEWSTSYLSRIERGLVNVSIGKLHTLSKEYGLSMSKLFKGF